MSSPRSPVLQREGLFEQAGGVDRARHGAVGVEAEERAHRDSQRQSASPGVEVDVLAGGELIECALGLCNHHLNRGEDPLAVKAGEHRQARAPVEVAVDRQQAIAHQTDQFAHMRFSPGEVGGVGDRHVVVGGRPEHEHDVAVEQPQREDRPVALVGLQQQRQRIVVEAPGAREREASVAGRKGDGRGTLLAQVSEHRRERVGVEQWRRTDERH